MCVSIPQGLQCSQTLNVCLDGSARRAAVCQQDGGAGWPCESVSASWSRLKSFILNCHLRLGLDPSMHTSLQCPSAKEDAESTGPCPQHRGMSVCLCLNFSCTSEEKVAWRQAHGSTISFGTGVYLLPPGTHLSHLKDKQHSYSLKINRGGSGDLSRLSSLPLPCTIYLVIILNYSHKNFHETIEKNHLFLYICHLVFYITTGGTYRSNRELYCGMLLKKIKRKNLFALVPEVFSITNLLLKKPQQINIIFKWQSKFSKTGEKQ